jgi:hypothetical protein
MEKEIRSLLASTTLAARRLLEEEFARQIEGTFDIFADGRVSDGPSNVLTAEQRFIREKIVASIERRRDKGESAEEAVYAYMRECAFTFLNRLAAFKMMESRGLVQECVSRGPESSGFKEFTGLAPGLAVLPDKGYRLYLECLCDEIGREVGVLFNRNDAASLLWPARRTLDEVLERLNDPALAAVWGEDETIGWIYQYYNDPAERKRMRDESSAPRNSRELAVRNQFFTPRYVVEFLTDNTLGRLWYEMTKGRTQLATRCRYLIRRPNEVFLGNPSVIAHLNAAAPWVREVITTANFSALPEDPAVWELSDLGLAIDGYGEMKRRGRSWDDFAATFYQPRSAAASGDWEGDAFELWCALFAYQRDALRNGHHKDSDRASGDTMLRGLWPALRHALQHPPTGLSQEETLRQPVFIPHRPIKDPRELRLIDPACGSMHFGLYAFDLLSVIYGEAYSAHVDSGTQALCTAAGVSVLADSASDATAFAREVPRLIVERNIHGVDIDPRAAQIAGLALWLRAQKEWQGLGLSAVQRPTIRRSNIVCAEPMPGDPDRLKEFCASLQQPVIGGMVEAICEKMRLAGEAGSLLKIEEEIRDLVHATKLRWTDTHRFEKGEEELFPKAEILAVSRPRDPVQTELPVDFSGITDESFWERAEERIYSALRAYAEASEHSDGFQRRLFAEDAARGFAFIDLCRQRYDVALMNPPFGDASLPSKPYIEDTYGDTKGDVYKAFVECFHARLVPAGYLGIISSRTGFFLSGSEDWRTRVVLRLFRPIALADLGMGVLDAMVEVAAYVLRSLSAPEARDLTLSIVPVLEKVARDSQDRFSLPKWQAARGGLKRHQAVAELEHLAANGFIQRSPGDLIRYSPLWYSAKKVTAPPNPVYPPLVCVRALAEDNKGAALAETIGDADKQRMYVCSPSSFAAVPGSPFAYWASQNLLRLFGDLGRKEDYPTRNGLSTCDDFRFVRLFGEIESDGIRSGRWCPFAKGGAYSPFYADIPTLVTWGSKQPELEAFGAIKGNAARSKQSSEFYFRPGLTWPLRAKAFSPQAMPTGCIFSVRGYAMFAPNSDLAPLLGITASSVFDYLFKLLLGRFGFPEFVVGVLDVLPIPDLSNKIGEALGSLASRGWATKQSLDASTSTSHAFVCPPLLFSTGSALAERAAAWAARVRTSEETVAAIQAEIDDLAFRLYGLNAADRAALTSTLATEATGDAEAAESVEDEEEQAATADAPALTADLLAYALGCAFGRWDIRFGTGERPAPPAPDPFAPLPVCPPGMLQNAAGLPAAPGDVAANYPVRITWPGLLVDDPAHPEDIERRGREILAVLFAARADAIADEACALLGAKSLREWFRKPAGFFADHLKRYSKSRRQAPIFWMIASPGGLYTLWIYYHRLSPDTFFAIQREFVKPKLDDEERHLFNLKQAAGPSPTPSQAREIGTATALVEDLRAFRDEVQRVAPLWRPNLNDGVIINHAPLWRLTPHAPWRKALKETWDALVAGDYDWAHLALHLWPERVIPKCAGDRSLAIAHDLESFFWEQDTETEKWVARKRTESEIKAMVAERSSPAVKAALDSLLNASAPSAGATKRARKSKET